jgi:hypothetical protein
MVLAALNPSTDKKHVVYNFEMAVKSGLVPRRIQIEDQTEDPVHTIVDDAAPHLDGGRWKLTTTVLDPKDAGNEWITQLDDSIRVFRVTVTLADGTTVVLRQPALFPVYEKQLIRVMLGIDKIPK